jgi:hypothetical protein
VEAAADGVAVRREALVIGQGDDGRGHAAQCSLVGAGDGGALQERLGGDARRHMGEATGGQ